MAVRGACRNWSISWSSVARLRGVIVVLFDSNSMDERARISSNFFWSKGEGISASDGVVGDGAFGDGAAAREGAFVREAFGDGVARERVVGEGAFGDGPAEDAAIIRSSSSSPACVRGAISRSTVALARLPSTWPLTTIVRPSMMMEPRSVMCAKTGRTWETLSAQATGPILGSTANSSTTLPGVAP